MQIDKKQIIDLIKSRGNDQQASDANSELPPTVDTDKDSGLLDKFGVSPQDLIKKLGGFGS